MSFSREVKEELAAQVSLPRHCQVAELAAYICYVGKIAQDKAGNRVLFLHSENGQVIRKCFTLLKKVFNIYMDMDSQSSDSLCISEGKQLEKVLSACRLSDGDNSIVNPLLIKNACCKRAFLKAAYLAAGSMSNPERSYHLEFVCDTDAQAKQLQSVIGDFAIEAKVIIRKNHHIVYIKDSSEIVDLLNVTGAHVSLMNLENLRIVKEVRNSVNRRVNCEAANITKTVNASSRQIEDIKLIQEKIGLKNLPEALREIAEARLEHPDISLKELGQFLNPTVGKSGVNHRLRKLGVIAEELRLL